MKSNKGFTLIELLAVIVILAIIALIATPIVLNIMKSAKQDSALRSGELYIDAVENAIAKAQLDSTVVSDGTYAVMENGNLCKETINNGTCTGEKITVEASGKIPGKDQTSGTDYGKVIISAGKVVKDTGTYFYINSKRIICKNNKLVLDDSSTSSSEVESFVPIAKGYKCQRATVLHTETCSYSGGKRCYGLGTTITYGNLGTKGTLNSGDAFDCDVNGDGKVDSTRERFYYVSSKDGDNTSDYVTLIYYNNVSAGVANNTTKFAYGQGNSNGPTNARKQLPTTTQWSNISLSTTTRSIINEVGGNTTSGGTLPGDFSYSGYAARLLTAQELSIACGITASQFSYGGALDNCKYLLENTVYSNNKISVYGFWLETPHSVQLDKVWHTMADEHFVSYYETGYNAGTSGVRPAIEVKKTDIDY